MRIDRNQSVALIIDVQERLFPHMAGKEKILDKCCLFLDGVQVLGLQVLVTEQYPRGLGSTLPAISEKIGDFRPIEKTSFSCMDEPRFGTALEGCARSQVLICGIESHVCVLQTVIDMLDRGFQPVVLRDACSSRFDDDMQVAFRRMEAEGAIISTVESILFELTRRAGTEEFKLISKLVK